MGCCIWKRPIRKFIKFFLDLYTEIQIAICPHTTKLVPPLKNGAIVPFEGEDFSRRNTGHTRPNNSYGVYIIPTHQNVWILLALTVLPIILATK